MWIFLSKDEENCDEENAVIDLEEEQSFDCDFDMEQHRGQKRAWSPLAEDQPLSKKACYDEVKICSNCAFSFY